MEDASGRVKTSYWSAARKKSYPDNLIGDILNDRYSRADNASDGVIMPEVEKAMPLLNDRERYVLELRYVERLTYAQIGGMLGVSAKRVNQICNRILQRLRKPLRDMGLVNWIRRN